MRIRRICDLNSHRGIEDSHAGQTHKSHLEADRRSFTIIDGADSPAFSARVYYPRIKVLSDGTYIMFHQDGRVSGNCFYTRSSDGLSWSPRVPMFMSYKTVRDDGESDFVYYCNCDAQVMPDGEILAFCSYRYRSGYNLDSKYSGIVMKRSRDNGETWTDEKLIYLGRNWESAPLLLKSGELQLYFSHTAPKFYLDPKVKTDAKIHTSSGSALIRSFDGGHTWIPDVKEPPYAAHRVTQTYVETLETGTKCFTNQMPVAAELHCGDIALATESDMARGRFLLTMSYTHDNWARALDIDEDGPEDKSSAFDFGAGPYFVQFESGETLLSYNTADQFHLRLGDEYGKNLTSERDVVAFDGNPGYWGCLCVDASHRVLAAMPKVWEDRTTRPWTSDNDMMLCRYYLNHTINAPVYSGDDAFCDEAWENSTDVLFVGAQTDAQMSIGFMHDSDNLYIRLDRLDSEVKDGCERLYIRIGDRTAVITHNASGAYVQIEGNTRKLDSVMYTVSEFDTDNACEFGHATVIKLDMPMSCDKISVYAEIDAMTEQGIVTAFPTGVASDDCETWFDVLLD